MSTRKFLITFLFACLVLNLNVATHAAQVERQKSFALQKGDCIGILAPASYLKGLTEGKTFKRGIEFLQRQGYRIKIAPSCNKKFGCFAGTEAERAADINAFFADDEVKAILCVRGGYGAACILDKLDYEMIARHPKPLIGYSDITALHTALGEKTGLVTFHAPMLVSIKDFNSYTKAEFLTGLTRTEPIGEIVMPRNKKLKTLVAGEADGIIVGGNLAVLTSLVGTPYELDGTGALLLLEDVDENAYRIDRMLNQLYQSGLLNRVNGILFGDFTNCKDGDFSVAQVLERYAKLVGKPAISGFPVGHEKNNAFLPLGVQAVMTANDNGSASVKITDSAFKVRD